MKTSVKTRYARKEDINGVVRLWSEFMEEHNRLFKTGFQPTEKNIKIIKRNFRKKLKLKGLMVAEYNKELIGYILFSRHEHPLEKDFTVGFISDVYIRKGYRSLGAGRKLINKVHEIFKRKKCDRVTLKVVYQNRKAVKLYKKLGYKNRAIDMYKDLK